MLNAPYLSGVDVSKNVGHVAFAFGFGGRAVGGKREHSVYGGQVFIYIVYIVYIVYIYVYI